ncbi:MAG: hypothetical protein RL095_1450 [Verrucomicrobiota bacterium]|jgi:arsenite-transporting ATPase
MKAFPPDLADLPRHLFFTGKGGVGKTSLSCSLALALAESGRKVLLISTDPASNLDEVLETPLISSPRPVPACPGLSAMNIDPHAAAAAYRERVIAPLRGVLPASALSSLEEQFNGSCTVEIAAFDQFAGLLAGEGPAAAFDHLVFDTAPTGHTLRLIGLAGAWDEFLKRSHGESSCLGPLAGLQQQREIYRLAVAALRDPGATRIFLVSRPQPAALREAQRSSIELAQLGIKGQELILNGILPAVSPLDRLACALRRRQVEALEHFRDFLAAQPCREVFLLPRQVLGIAGLRRLLGHRDQPSVEADLGQEELRGWRDFASLVEETLELKHGVVMTMGKGGVGKTSVAAALALALVRAGRKVLLTTTDPAAHVAAALSGQFEGLELACIDPVVETAAYREEVLRIAGSGLDEESLALLEEDLSSPCTEEIAVFRAFARAVDQGRERIVVIDTAPTGHTLLLLDATRSHHRELERQRRSQHPEEVMQLLPRLRDPQYCRILLVALPEATPVHEAIRLEEDLARAGIPVAAWVINQSLHGLDCVDPLLVQRQRQEGRALAEILRRRPGHVHILPLLAGEPRGIEGLTELLGACGATPPVP